jgi:hypothetical protein
LVASQKKLKSAWRRVDMRGRESGEAVCSDDITVSWREE